MSALALAASLVFALAGDLEVTGDATCPIPAEVSRRLGELMPAAPDASKVDPSGTARVVVSRGAGALELVLLDPSGHELASRALAAEGSCDDLAAAAAVVVAAWRADLNPDLTPGVTLLAETPSLPPPAPTPVLAAREAPQRARPVPYTVGLGLLASETGGAFAPGAVVTGAVELSPSGLGLDAGLSGTTSRSAAVGTIANAASWSRVTLALGPALTRTRGSIRAGLHAQALVALLRVRGVDLASARSDTTAELGLGAGAKLELVTGTSAIWLGVDLWTWPGTQRLVISGLPNEEGQLSQFEGVASLGLSLGRFP